MKRPFCWLALIAVLSIFPGAVAAQDGGVAFQSRDWRGRPIDYVCKASPHDAEGLRQALIRQELFRIGSDAKSETGWYYGDRLRTARLRTRDSTAAQIIERIRQRLQSDSYSLPTAVLVYDVGAQRGRSMLCVWLLTSQGITAAETVPITKSAHVRLGGFAESARDVLGVTRVTLARAPLPRNPPPVSSDPSRERPADVRADGLSVVSGNLLPGSVARALVASGSERVLVLPAADFSTVPFAALSLQGRLLIDFASVVILTGIDELVSPLRRDIWAGRFDQLSSSWLVVADPDSATDKLLWAPLPGAREEAELVGGLLGNVPGQIVVGADATPEATDRALRTNNLSFIYFATHGIADAIDPLVQSFLLLSGGRLHVKEIAKQRHERAPLVVMSACQSGLGKTFEGGTFGLARGWLAAGASQVVTSLWDIGDETTKDLMADFARRMIKDKLRPEVALRAAMLTARNERKVPMAGWAGFALLGFASE